MGITLIYLMPIHPIGKVNRKGTLGSPYSIADYLAIDPALGTEADLKSFVDKAHSLNMHVIMDLVANHTAWDNVLTVQHPDWYKHTSDGKFKPPVSDWTDVIQLDHSNPDLLNYMIDMTTHYMKADGIDGFRCDYSTGVPLSFWVAWRAALKKANPDAFLLSENDDESLAEIFDATYDQDTYKTMTDAFLRHKPGILLIQPLADRRDHGDQRLRARFLENHDQSRLAYVFQTSPPEALQAANAYLLTTDDIPFIENGQEVGITQTLSLFEPDKINWNIGNPALRDTFKKILAVRNANPALRHGDIADVKSSDPNALAFLRRSPDQQVLVAISFGKDPVHVAVDPAVAAHRATDLTDGSSVDLTSGLDMPPWSWRIIDLK
jgi:glycosidase